MDPTLLAYMQQQSSQQNKEDNPIEGGTQSGIQAAKQSLGLDEAQKARARGMAFMTLGHHLAHPGHGPGFGGALKAFTTGLLPAAHAYEGEAQKGEAMNAHLMQQLQMEQMKRDQLAQQERMAQAKLQQRQQEQEALQGHRAAQLGEMRGYHQGRLGLEERKLAEKVGVIPGTGDMPGIPIASLTPGARTAEHKVFNEHKTAAKKNEKSIHILQEMKKIFNEHPDIGDSYFHLLKDDTFLGKTQRSLMNKNKLTAIQKLNKLGNDLVFEKIKGIPAKGLNQFLEKKISQSVASGESTKDAADFVINEMINDANNVIDDSKNYMQSYQKGYIPIPSEAESQGKSPGAEIESPGSAIASPMGQTIQMQTPDGKTWNIPADKVAAAKARGAVEIGQ